MALADILQRIGEDSLEEAAAIIAAAEGDAAALRARAEERARARADEIMARAREQAESAAQTRLAEARLAARDNALAAKRHLVERVVAQAAERVTALPADQYAALIVRWVAEVASGGETLSIGHDDHGRLGVRLDAPLKAAGVPVTIRGTTAAIGRGVLVEGDRVRVEVSVRARVDSRREEIVALVIETLFGAERGGSAPEEVPRPRADDVG